MMSSAILSRKQRAYVAAFGCVAVVTVLGAGSSRAEGPEAAASPSEAVLASPVAAAFDSVPNGVQPFSDHFPNLVVKTHDGRNVHFYDDLLKGKIVLINFMYATCTER